MQLEIPVQFSIQHRDIQQNINTVCRHVHIFDTLQASIVARIYIPMPVNVNRYATVVTYAVSGSESIVPFPRALYIVVSIHKAFFTNSLAKGNCLFATIISSTYQQ